MKGEELLAEKRTGKQVMLVESGKEALACVEANGDSVAVTTDARLLVFPLEQVPELARGRGVGLQLLHRPGLVGTMIDAAQQNARKLPAHGLKGYAGLGR